MGTTVTPNLALIKPDTAESIKQALPTFAGWASQNGSNCDKIDGLFRASTHTYTPVWGATTTPPTLGAGGSVAGKYMRIYPRLVFGEIRIFCGGAGFAGGTGSYTLTLPATAPPEFATFFDTAALGKVILLDSDTVLNSTVGELQYTNTGVVLIRSTAGISVTQASPFTFAQNDRISAYFMYPTADA